MLSPKLYSHAYGILVCIGSLPTYRYVMLLRYPFYYAVIVQRPRIDQFCMSQVVIQLVAGTFCYENVVMHIMRMVFHSNVESHKLMPG